MPERDALSIGEFARASGLTPKALRLYDELDLLPPARVDPRSGYRTYDGAQLDRARLVASLRMLGMPLARIRVVCDLPPASAAAEVTSYWRQVEADVATRAELVSHLVERLSGEDDSMSTTPNGFELVHAVRTARGLVRESDQDAAYGGRHLVAVADGYGDAASDAASHVALAALERHDEAVAVPRLLEVCDRALDDARAAVRELAVREGGGGTGGSQALGTTLTATLWSGGQVALAHIGDSRAYLLRDGELTQQTHDHSYVQSLVDEGRLTQEEAATHPDRPQLMRALHGADEGAGGSLRPDLQLREVRRGDVYLLCTDGVHTVLDDGTIRAALVAAREPDDAVTELDERVHAAGAPDNAAYAVVAVR